MTDNTEDQSTYRIVISFRNGTRLAYTPENCSREEARGIVEAYEDDLLRLEFIHHELRLLRCSEIIAVTAEKQD